MTAQICVTFLGVSGPVPPFKCMSLELARICYTVKNDSIFFKYMCLELARVS